MENCRFHILRLDKKLPNTEILYYVVWLGKIIDVQKSRFQVTKVLKINTINT